MALSKPVIRSGKCDMLVLVPYSIYMLIVHSCWDFVIMLYTNQTEVIHKLSTELYQGREGLTRLGRERVIVTLQVSSCLVPVIRGNLRNAGNGCTLTRAGVKWILHTSEREREREREGTSFVGDFCTFRYVRVYVCMYVCMDRMLLLKLNL